MGDVVEGKASGGETLGVFSDGTGEGVGEGGGEGGDVHHGVVEGARLTAEESFHGRREERESVKKNGKKKARKNIMGMKEECKGRAWLKLRVVVQKGTSKAWGNIENVSIMEEYAVK